MNQAELENQRQIGERWREFLDAINYDSSKLRPYELYVLGGLVMKTEAVQRAAIAATEAMQVAYPYAAVKLDTLLAAQKLPKATKAEIRVLVDTAKATLPPLRF
jgi:hypothetical protein